MCIRFVLNGDEMLTGFNFDIDLGVWNHRILLDEDRFAIGIRRPDGLYHCYHGVNRNGNAGTLLYVHGSPAGAFADVPGCLTIADLTERFVKGEISLDEALRAVQTKRIVYAPDATMQALLSDARGRALTVEPGVGYRMEWAPLSLLANGSCLDPESTRPFAVPGDDRYERAQRLLSGRGRGFTASDALEAIREVRQEGEWATRVSFVYAPGRNTVYYVLNNRFDEVSKHEFAAR